MLRRLALNSALSRAAAVTAPLAFSTRYAAVGGRPPQQGGVQGGRAPPQQMQQQMQQQQRISRQQAPVEEEPQEDEVEEVPPPPPKRPEKEPTFFKLETDANGVATIKLSRKPVNSLNLEFFSELLDWLLWIGTDETYKALILSSEIPMVFSAGLDIHEFKEPQVERLGNFWTSFQEVFMVLNSYPKPLVAAINGNAPAGGCILALCCDYRVMARAPKSHPDKFYRIGLNETKLGIIAPPWVMTLYSYTIGQRKAERMLQLGSTPTADEALAIGLVDEVVDEDQVISAAQREVGRLLAVPNQARWMSRDMMRRELTVMLTNEEERNQDTNFVIRMITNADVQKSISQYLERLGGGKK